MSARTQGTASSLLHLFVRFAAELTRVCVCLFQAAFAREPEVRGVLARSGAGRPTRRTRPRCPPSASAPPRRAVIEQIAENDKCENDVIVMPRTRGVAGGNVVVIRRIRISGSPLSPFENKGIPKRTKTGLCAVLLSHLTALEGTQTTEVQIEITRRAVSFRG